MIIHLIDTNIAATVASVTPRTFLDLFPDEEREGREKEVAALRRALAYHQHLEAGGEPQPGYTSAIGSFAALSDEAGEERWVRGFMPLHEAQPGGPEIVLYATGDPEIDLEDHKLPEGQPRRALDVPFSHGPWGVIGATHVARCGPDWRHVLRGLMPRSRNESPTAEPKPLQVTTDEGFEGAFEEGCANVLLSASAPDLAGAARYALWILRQETTTAARKAFAVTLLERALRRAGLSVR